MEQVIRDIYEQVSTILLTQGEITKSYPVKVQPDSLKVYGRCYYRKAKNYKKVNYITLNNLTLGVSNINNIYDTCIHELTHAKLIDSKRISGHGKLFWKEYRRLMGLVDSFLPQHNIASSKKLTKYSLQEVCEEIGIDPKKARNILRKNNISKPSCGTWTWSYRPQEVVELLKNGG